MVAIRNLIIALIVGAVALVVAASTIRTSHDRVGSGPAPAAQTSGPASLSRSEPVPRSRPSSAAARRTGQLRRSAHRAGSRPAGRVPAPGVAPASGAGFGLVVHARSGEISAPVESISVASNQPVDPPRWNTAAWVEQSSYPSARSRGTSYIYGHACHHHVCSFTRLKDAALGDAVSITTTSARLTYRITRIGLSPKTASSLPAWASDSSVPNRLVLITCAYEQGDTSTENIILIATLQR